MAPPPVVAAIDAIAIDDDVDTVDEDDDVNNIGMFDELFCDAAAAASASAAAAADRLAAIVLGSNFMILFEFSNRKESNSKKNSNFFPQIHNSTISNSALVNCVCAFFLT